MATILETYNEVHRPFKQAADDYYKAVKAQTIKVAESLLEAEKAMAKLKPIDIEVMQITKI